MSESESSGLLGDGMSTWMCGGVGVGVTDAACWTSDELGGVLLADEDLEQAQFGFDAFVLLVLIRHGHAVFFLDVPIKTAVSRSVGRPWGLFRFEIIIVANKHCSSALFQELY